MHTPSAQLAVFELAVSWLGGLPHAAIATGISVNHLHCIRYGTRRITERTARRIEEATSGRYRAADLLGLSTPPAKRRKVA